MLDYGNHISVKLSRWALSVVLCLALLPYALRLIGVYYMPNATPLYKIPSNAVLIISAIIFIPMGWKIFEQLLESFAEGMSQVFKWLVVGVFGFFLNAFGVLWATQVTLPMVHTALLGQDGSTSFQVTDNHAFPGWRHVCYSALEVESVVWGFDMICSVPKPTRSATRKGDIIIAKGRASKAGIFYTDISRATVAQSLRR